MGQPDTPSSEPDTSSSEPDAPPSGEVRIRGPRLVLRPLRTPEEIDAAWRAMATADPMTIGELPDEARFRARLQRSGRLHDGWLDLAIDLDGVAIGRIQTFVPPGRPLPAGTFDVGIDLRENMRGKGYGREALALLTDWLFEHAAAEVVEAGTDPRNVAMRTVFQRVGWRPAGSLKEAGREWVMYRITRRQWDADRPGSTSVVKSLATALSHPASSAVCSSGC
jgi:RimJ/RimL family protein N-acetyltransferase